MLEALTGTAEDAKGGAMVVTDSQAVYVQGLDAWPEGVRGQVVVVYGELTETHQVPVATVDATGAWSTGKTGSSMDTVIVPTRWELQGSVEAAKGEAIEPAPWSIRYADGSGNATRMWSADGVLRCTTDPVQPAESSSGVYSGGTPGEGDVAPDAARAVWVLLRQLEADVDSHVEQRAMGTGSFTVVTPTGERSFLVKQGDALAAFDEALRAATADCHTP
jgi:hypothetical protein